ncbi:MAG: DUF4296 domain-containing protein [Chitinophagales bacterium]
MYRRSWILVLVFLWSSCKEGKERIPSDVVQRDTMVQILSDIHIADAVVEKKSSAERPDTALTEGMYQQIFQHHGITRQQFYSSYHYYEQHPALMNELYPDVISELSRRQANAAK